RCRSAPVALSKSTISLRAVVATVLLSGEIASARSWLNRQGLIFDRPVSECRRSPVAASHRRIVPSRPPREARNRLSAETTTCPTAAWWPESLCSSFPLSTSHKRTVSSQPPEARVLPSGEKATELTPPSPVAVTSASSGARGSAGGLYDRRTCPINRRSSLPDSAANSRTVLSRPPEASSLPSGEYAIAVELWR